MIRQEFLRKSYQADGLRLSWVGVILAIHSRVFAWSGDPFSLGTTWGCRHKIFSGIPAWSRKKPREIEALHSSWVEGFLQRAKIKHYFFRRREVGSVWHCLEGRILTLTFIISSDDSRAPEGIGEGALSFPNTSSSDFHCPVLEQECSGLYGLWWVTPILTSGISETELFLVIISP